MKISPVRAEFLEDGRTDMKKLTVDFRNFANAPKKSFRISQKTHCISIQNMNILILFPEIFATNF